MATTEQVNPDEKESLRAQRILARIKNKQLRRCLTRGEWESLLYQTPTQVKVLVQKLAVFHHYLPEDTICPTCGRKKAAVNDGV